MNVKWADVKADYARKDAEIAELKEALQGVLSELMCHTGEKAGECTGWAGEAEDLLNIVKEFAGHTVPDGATHFKASSDTFIKLNHPEPGLSAFNNHNQEWEFIGLNVIPAGYEELPV